MDGCEREELDSVVMGNVSLSSQANWIAFKCFSSCCLYVGWSQCVG